MKYLTSYFKKYKNYKDEKFKWVTYPGIKEQSYVISNYGQLIRFKNNKILKTYEDKDGYYRVRISKKTCGIHRLVCWEFNKKGKKEYNVVNHKDTNIHNNYYKNLVWTDVKGNTRHAIKNGLTTRSGCNTASSKYSQETIDKICKELEKGTCVLDIYHIFYPNSKTTDHNAFYKLIYSIYKGTRQVVNRKKYNIRKNRNKNPYFKKYTKKEIKLIQDLLLDGKKTGYIIKRLGYGNVTTYNSIDKRKMYDKIRIERNKLIKEGKL